MTATMTVIDLKEHEEFLDQYIVLRNRYADLLLTTPVTRPETKTWLQNSNIEIRGIVQKKVLLGVVILYLKKGGEIAFFVNGPNKGIGSQLLHIIKQVARDKGLKSIWAWVLQDNTIAQRAFEKNGFTKTETGMREYKGMGMHGIKYTLELTDL